MKLRLNANAVVTNVEGKFLLIELKVGPFKGGLCIPGGGVNPGELSHEAARREVLEETGIDVDSEFKPFGFCELKNTELQKHKVIMLSHAKYTGLSEAKETEEGIAGWYTYEEAEKDLIPFAKEALRIWKNGESHFNLIDEKTEMTKTYS